MGASYWYQSIGSEHGWRRREIPEKLSDKKYEVSKEIDIRIAQKNVRVNCRECPGAEIPKKINMVLTKISRHDLWNRKKFDQERFSV